MSACLAAISSWNRATTVASPSGTMKVLEAV